MFPSHDRGGETDTPFENMKKANLKATLKRYDDNRYFHRNDFDWIAKKNIQLIDETFKKKKK